MRFLNVSFKIDAGGAYTTFPDDVRLRELIPDEIMNETGCRH